MFLHLAHFSKTTKRSERKEGTNAAAAQSSSGPRESETTDREGMGHSPLLSCQEAGGLLAPLSSSRIFLI